jgi:hypothetical protein
MTEETEVTQPEILRFNGEEYPIDGLSDKARYLAGQIQDLQSQSNAQKARLDQIEVAIQGFSSLLTEELAPKEEETSEE